MLCATSTKPFSRGPTGLATFSWVARGKGIQAKSFNISETVDWMERAGAPPQALRIVKSPIGAADTGDLGSVPISAWADSARTASAFYRIWSDGSFVKAPINSHVALTSIPSAGSAIGEGAFVPLSPVAIQIVAVTATKVVSLIVVSDELLRDVSAAGQTAFNRALMGAMADAVDKVFISRLLADAGAFTAASSGPLATNAQNDLRTALLNVNSSGGSSRLYWIAGVNTAKRASTLATTTGASAFVDMSATGGELAGLPAIVSSGIAADSLVLVDASGIAADAGPPSVKASIEADVQMDSAPVETAAMIPTSMFQTNHTAIKSSAWFGVQPLRDDAVAQITGIAWAAA